MKKKLAITIEVDPESRDICVKDDSGSVRPIKSIVVIGGDAERGILYLFGWGSSSDAAWAYKEGFLHANECGDAPLKNFYKQCACHIAQCVCPRTLRQEVEADELLERWIGEDREPHWH